jgi:hypothetical protein
MNADGGAFVRRWLVRCVRLLLGVLLRPRPISVVFPSFVLCGRFVRNLVEPGECSGFVCFYVCMLGLLGALGAGRCGTIGALIGFLLPSVSLLSGRKYQLQL